MALQPYFKSDERRAELYKVLESWVGTPHRHLVAVKGRGADCALFSWEVMKEVGYTKGIANIPRKYGHIDYPPDRAIHSKEEVLLNCMRTTPSFMEMDKSRTPMDGDICTYQFGKSTAHIAIYYNGRIYHAMSKSEVLPTRFDDKKFMARLTAVFRLMEEVV